MNKKLAAAAIVAGGLASLSSVTAAQAAEFGNVISRTAIVQQVAVPSQSCTTQQVVTPPPERGFGGSIVGAVAGGLLGSTVGGGNGRIAAAAVGAATGAVVGDRIENSNNTGRVQPVQTCQTVTTYENRTVGYDVVYEYAGRQYSARLNRDPGTQIPLVVAPEPGLMLAAPVSTAVSTVIEPVPMHRPRPYRPVY